jgi:hypothetical protein
VFVEGQVEGRVGDKGTDATFEGQGREVFVEERQVFFAEGLIGLGEIFEISSFLIFQANLFISFLNNCK